MDTARIPVVETTGYVKIQFNNYKNLLNYFGNRNTNASTESFNAKIKASRSQFRGVRKIDLR